MTVTLHSAADYAPDDLLRAAEGRDPRLARQTALALLSARCDGVAAGTFARIARDEAEPAPLRAAALAHLWRVDRDRAAEISLPLLHRDVAERVALAAMRGLGRLGDAAALEALQGCTGRGRRGRVARQMALILAARLGLAGPRLDRPGVCAAADPGPCPLEARVRPARRLDRIAAREALADEPMALRLDLDAALQVEGSGFEWLLLPVEDRRRLLSISAAPAMVAVVMEWDPSGERWLDAFLLLADAAEEEGGDRTLGLIDAGGEIVMSGRLRPGCDEAAFDLGPSSATMLQATIHGTLGNETFSIDRFAYRPEVAGRRAAKRI